jgi:hypothetical protein
MICPPILMPPNPSRASLVRHSLCKLNRTGDKQHNKKYLAKRNNITFLVYC